MLPLLAPSSVYEYMSTHHEAELNEARQRYLAKRQQLLQDSEIRGPSPSPSGKRLVKRNKKKHTRLLSLPTSRTKTAHPHRHGFLHITRVPWEISNLPSRSKKHHDYPVAVQCHVHIVRETSFAGSLFKRLPREVYDLILQKLEQIYHCQPQERTEREGWSGRPSPYLRDLYSLSLTSRAWNRAATDRMYHHISLAVSLPPSFSCSSSSSSYHHRPPLLTPPLTRLKLLRLTLRSSPHLATLVTTLDLTLLHPIYLVATIEKETITNAIASLIMACPHLERIHGFPLKYTHRFSRYEHALSTRRHLKEKTWILADPDPSDVEEEEEEDFGYSEAEMGLQAQYQHNKDLHDFGADPTTKFYHPSNDPTERFLDLNSRHPHLSHLTIRQHYHYCSSSITNSTTSTSTTTTTTTNAITTPLTFRALIGTLHLLPSLRHLGLIALPACSFTNLTLMSLPHALGLRTLRLEGLPGVNEKGVRRFVSEHPVAVGLERLELVGMMNLKTGSWKREGGGCGQVIGGLIRARLIIS
ncbi:uncharacterized protein EI97DRAFT_110228 [Westerdykella ornata]|uniref:Uncharacterized protein n=1 Tax=Westerdykella ornata TaxID=318751 RepID=A0A6A6JTX5_WESOR|nr:uncharacterized protein EI97DRAFT_110228 [Westerdykella ornata]KAF2280080.1 hypothetical protein EI97DRAFT_110228 [Westerdykella ornata]